MHIIVVQVDRPTMVDAEAVAEFLPRYLPGAGSIEVLDVVSDGFVLKAAMEFGTIPKFSVQLAANDAHLEGVRRIEVI